MRLALVVLLLLGSAGVARAGAPDCAARLAWIDARLARTAHRARVWTWGWGIGLAALTAANLAVVPLVDDEEEIDWYVGAATSFVGLVPLVVLPLDVMDDAGELHARIRAGTPCEVLLPEAERLLAHEAANQEEGTAWWMHAANWAINGGAGLVLGLGYDRWTSGILTAVVGGGIGELMIWTQPVDSVGDLERYRRGERSWRLVPTIAGGELGLVLSTQF